MFATIAAISTSEAEKESLTLKLHGTVSLLQVLAVKPDFGESVRRALLRANSRVCKANYDMYRVVEPKKNVLIRFMESRTYPKNKVLVRIRHRGIK